LALLLELHVIGVVGAGAIIVGLIGGIHCAGTTNGIVVAAGFFVVAAIVVVAAVGGVFSAVVGTGAIIASTCTVVVALSSLVWCYWQDFW